MRTHSPGKWGFNKKNCSICPEGKIQDKTWIYGIATIFLLCFFFFLSGTQICGNVGGNLMSLFTVWHKLSGKVSKWFEKSKKEQINCVLFVCEWTALTFTLNDFKLTGLFGSPKLS